MVRIHGYRAGAPRLAGRKGVSSWRPPKGQPVQFGSAGSPDWTDKPVAIIGGGPSLSGFDFERLRGRFHVLTVSASCFTVPWADAGFCLDHTGIRNWWQRFVAEVRFPLYLATTEPVIRGVDTPPSPHMIFLRRQSVNFLSENPLVVSGGGTSGFGAVNLAVLKGTKAILLLGFDYGTTTNQWHHNQAEYGFAYDQKARQWAGWALNFQGMKPLLQKRGVEVINASPASLINCFPRIPLDEAIELWS